MSIVQPWKSDLVGATFGFSGGVVGLKLSPLILQMLNAGFLIPIVAAVVGFLTTRLLRRLFPDTK